MKIVFYKPHIKMFALVKGQWKDYKFLRIGLYFFYIEINNVK